MTTQTPDAPGAQQQEAPQQPQVEYVPGKARHIMMHRIFWVLLVGIPAIPWLVLGIVGVEIFARLSRIAGWFASMVMGYGTFMERRLGRWFPCRVPKEK